MADHAFLSFSVISPQQVGCINIHIHRASPEARFFLHKENAAKRRVVQKRLLPINIMQI